MWTFFDLFDSFPTFTSVDCLSSLHIYLKVFFFLYFCEINLFSLPTLKFRYSSEFSIASSLFNFHFYIKIITYLLMLLKSLFVLDRIPDFYLRVWTLEAHCLGLNLDSAVICCLTLGQTMNNTVYLSVCFPIYEMIPTL